MATEARPLAAPARTPASGVAHPTAGAPRPVLYLAATGALLLAFELYVLGRWVTGPHFTRTPTGPDTVSDRMRLGYTLLQVGVSAAVVPCAWFWVIRPSRREGRLTTDAMFAL